MAVDPLGVGNLGLQMALTMEKFEALEVATRVSPFQKIPLPNQLTQHVVLRNAILIREDNQAHA
ncbi:hypothetical protein JHK87_010132 [Glycine soja]|nr:hypothetical protein JHK87_010132 [Glycine soja]